LKNRENVYKKCQKDDYDFFSSKYLIEDRKEIF